MKKPIGIISGILLLLSGVVSAQAQIGAQIQEELVSQIIYVNNQDPQASDQNPASQILPLKTISAAAQIATQNQKDNIGTRIIIYPGTYREQIDSYYGPLENNVPVIFEASQIGTVIVSGSDIWTGWQQSQDNSNMYTHTWPYDWGLVPDPPNWPILEDIVKRREMIFVDGRLLTQVLSLQEMGEGTFYVSEINDLVYIWPASGTNINNLVIEVATRSRLLDANRKKNMVLRGIIFQHDNTPVGVPRGAVTFSGSFNILIEDCQFLWNTWSGLQLNASQDVTVRRTAANSNGGLGAGAWKLKNLLWEDNESSYNNWRGASGGFTGWATAGTKHLRIRDSVYRRHKAVGNKARGFWFDYDNSNIFMENFFLCNNLKDGIFLEANQGPITMKNSIICYNKDNGISTGNSKEITLEGNTLYGNKSSQIRISGHFDAPRTVINWETGEEMLLKAEHWTLRDNVIISNNTDQYILQTTLSPEYWGHFQDSLVSERNLWHSPVTNDVFSIAGGVRLDFDNWQSVTNQDLSSIFASPQFANPDNYQFDPLPDSPLLAKQEWLTKESAPALVTVDNVSTCSAAMPTVTITPTHQSAAPGATLNYTVTLTNTDGRSCVQSNFALNLTPPGGWTGTLSPDLIPLLPGETGTATLAVTSVTSTPAGSYAITVNTTDTTSSLHTAATIATYEVQVLGDIIPPTAPADLFGIPKSRRKDRRVGVHLSWSAATDNVGVGSYTIWRDGVSLATTPKTRYKDRSIPVGSTYAYTVTAADAAGNRSSPSNIIMVTAATKGKEK